MDGAAPSSSFRDELAAALMADGADERLGRLARLAVPGLGHLRTIQLDNALRGVDADAQRTFVRVKIAICGSTTVAHLLPALRVAGLRRGLLIEPVVLGFGQYRQDILGEPSALAACNAASVLLAISAHDIVRGVELAADRDAADRAIAAAVAELRGLWRAARERFGLGVIQQSFLDCTEPLFGNAERLVPGAPGRVVAELNARLADAAALEGVLLLDVASASARDGIDAWFDQRHWLQGKMEIAPKAAERYGELLARLLGAQYGKSRKCLVLDLDNTLWGGVLGDAGLGGIVLGQGSAAGEAHLELQRYAKQLRERGIVLAVCSKNEPALVDEAFDKHPEMLLRRDDIAYFAVNWRDKAENLREIARGLNLGLDSLVFVDDNPVERARIRESLPMVAVPELPEDAAYYVRAIASEGYFESVAFTEEDRSRVDQYAANREREALLETSQSMDDFLRGLSMRLSYGPVTPLELPRVAQLINKTNQFNTTTRRMSAEEVERFAAADGNLALQFRLVDRFGDNGIVSVMLLETSGGPGTLELLNWVMSCRVFGRQLEHEALNVAVHEARQRGASEILASFIPTQKNAVIANLFETLGFARLPDAGGGEPGTSRWRLDLSTYRDHATHIAATGTP